MRSYLEVIMACCIAIAFVVAAARTAWAWILGRGPVAEVFPPAATWRSGAGIPVGDTSDAQAAPGASVGRALAATVLAYGLLVHLLVAVGAARWTDAASGWAVRDAVLAVLAAVLIIVVRRPTSPASSLVAVGVLWFALGVVDMHVVAGFEFSAAPLTLDAAFHLSGWWLAIAAAAVAFVQRRHDVVPIGVVA